MATACIIGLNFLVFLFTTENFLFIREQIVKDFGCQVGVTPIYTFFTAMFLHMDPLHLIGNMLFLWVFGPSVENRLGIVKYLALYFTAGFIGDLLQAALSVALGGKNLPGIGASGCIMGVVGAYWYMYSWSPICCLYWITWFVRGVAEIKAFWVIGIYVLLDLFEGLMGGVTGVSGGVANFAHLGGVAAGVLGCIVLKIPRDSSEVSELKAMCAGEKDLNNMPLYALEAMRKAEPENLELLHALVYRAMKTGEMNIISTAMTGAVPALIDSDPALVALFITDLRGDAGIYRSIHLLRLAGLMERQGNPDQAAQIYWLIANGRPTDPEAEAALYRLALIAWSTNRDAAKAKECVAELQRRFPYGEMVFHSNALLKKIG